MISFVKGIVYDLANKTDKLLTNLAAKKLQPELDTNFYDRTVELLEELRRDVGTLIASGDLEIPALGSNNIIRYNTFHERLLTLEVFRYLIIMNFGPAEIYFKKKIQRIYDEIHSLNTPPIITTISNSENYYWALPSYDIIAVPTGEEKSLLNLPDLYHEMGHLIFNQSAMYLKQDIEQRINAYYHDEIQRVVNEGRDPNLISFYREKRNFWLGSWVMEFVCDLIATYLVGPAYAWTNLKLTTLSSAVDRIYQDSPSHPSDESRMRAIFYMLDKMGHQKELVDIEASWGAFLSATNNPQPSNYDYIFPQEVITQLADYVFNGCKAIDLQVYSDQVTEFGNPISKILNDAWDKSFSDPDGFVAWERDQIDQIANHI